MKRQTIGIIGVIVLIIVLLIGASIKPKTEKEETNETDIFSTAYAESQQIKKEEQKAFNEINVYEYIDKYNGNTKEIVLIARPTCTYCGIAEPILHYIAYKYDININYLDVDKLVTDEEKRTFINSNEIFSENVGTPMLLIVSNGKIIDMVDGLTDTTHYLEFLLKNGIIK